MNCDSPVTSTNVETRKEIKYQAPFLRTGEAGLTTKHTKATKLDFGTFVQFVSFVVENESDSAADVNRECTQIHANDRCANEFASIRVHSRFH